MNDTLKTILERYSCRKFTGEMPTDEQLQAIAEAAVAAPSSVNRQAWRVIAVKNRELMADMEAEGLRIIAALEDKRLHERLMARGGTLFYGAPCIIMVPLDTAQLPDASLDCGIVCQNIALAATSLGLGNVICGLTALAFSGEKGEEFKKRLGFPEGFEFGGAVLVGCSAARTEPHEPDIGKISFIE